MYEGVKANGGPNTTGGLAISLYFVAVTCLGNCIFFDQKMLSEELVMKYEKGIFTTRSSIVR